MSFARSKPASDRDFVDLRILRRDQHEAVAEQIDPRRLIDVLLADRIVHPVGIGGDKNIRRRALFDLLGQCRTRGIAGDDPDAGLRGIGGADVVERVLHRGRGEHRQALVLRQRGRAGRSEQDDEGDEIIRQDDASWRSMRACGAFLRAQLRRRFRGMRQAEAPFRRSGGFTIRPDIAGCKPTALSGGAKASRPRLLLGVRRRQHRFAGGGQLRQRHRRPRLWRHFRRLRVEHRIA